MFNKLKNEQGNYSVELEVAEIAVLKTSMVAFGTLLGMVVKSKNKKAMAVISGAVFASGSMYLMHKFFTVLAETPFDDFDYGCDCGCGDHDVVDFESLYKEQE